ELHRPRIGRVGPDVVRRPGLGARAAERGSGVRPRRWRRRRRAALEPGELSSAPRRGSGPGPHERRAIKRGSAKKRPYIGRKLTDPPPGSPLLLPFARARAAAGIA